MFANKFRTSVFATLILLAFAAALTVGAQPAGAQSIDGINEKGMVIDDMWYPYADNVQFYANPEKTAPANPGDFREGSQIGFELDEDRKLSAVWLR